MLAPAVAAIRAHIETNYSALPLRWQNEPWGNVNPQNTDDPFIEVEVIGGRNSLEAFSSPGNRLFIHPGVVRFYICVPLTTGMTTALETADTLAAFMERAEFGQAVGQTVRTQDFSTYDSVATLEDGNYFVLMASCPFEFFYTN